MQTLHVARDVTELAVALTELFYGVKDAEMLTLLSKIEVALQGGNDAGIDKWCFGIRSLMYESGEEGREFEGYLY